MWERRGCRPSWALARPCRVIVPPPSIAPRNCRNRPASFIGAGGGGCNQGRSSPRFAPHWASSRAMGKGSTNMSSGTSKAGRRCCSVMDHSLRQWPGPSRPALPQRCLPLAWLEGIVTKPSMAVTGSRRLCRLRPLSITRPTPSIVSELYAMDVARISLAAPLGLGAMAFLWAPRGKSPWRGQTPAPGPSRWPPQLFGPS